MVVGELDGVVQVLVLISSTLVVFMNIIESE
jgi:hypothetical protein